MTGRARGRSRGRGAQDNNAPRPGAPQQPTQPQGRGRSRGQAPPQAQQAPPQTQRQAPPQAQRQAPPQAQRQAQQAPPEQQLASMSIAAQAPEQKSEVTQERRKRVGLDEIAGLSLSRSTRPDGNTKAGTQGTPLNIVSNFFKVIRLPKFEGLFQYSVRFEPDLQSDKLKAALLHEFDDMIGLKRVFDGMTMWLPLRLKDASVSKNVTTRQGNDVTVTISFTNIIPENSPNLVHLMNRVFRSQLKALNMHLIGRNYYNPEQKIDIPAHKLQVWPGLSTSILQYERDVMLCADVNHKILRQESVLDFLYALYTKAGDRFYDQASKELVGEIIITRYNNKTYRIDDIEWNTHPTDTFEVKGEKVTFKDYFKNNYGLDVKDLKQPLLVSKPRDKDKRRGMSGNILLLPEFCSITGLSEQIRANFTVMKDLGQHTRVGPADRVRSLEDFMKNLNANPTAAKELAEWNMAFEKSLLRMKGRVLPAETMFQGPEKFNYKPADADWSRESRGKKLISCANMTNWLLVHTQRDSSVANDFKQTLQRVCGPMGMNVGEPQQVLLTDDSARSYVAKLKEMVVPATQMVVCIVPNNRKDRYDAIKKLCCVNKPVPSQVVVSRTLSKKQMLMSVCTKIGIQLNCKMGGEVWAVEIPLKSLMVVGFDVYHDSMSRTRSMGGFVASTNQSLTKYYSRVTVQNSHEEISSFLKGCMIAALKQYHKVNNAYPQTIIVYRDGVGDGQLRHVEDHELAQLKSAFPEINPQYQPGFSMIIVKKRISTRLFAQQGNSYSNPPPGTVVDSVITRPEFYDFFLVSQSVRQGTVSPCHYNVISNSTKLKADHFQRLTYKLCHLYYNWPGTIRVPAPCQYAHKLAFLVGQSIHEEPDIQLADRLYYL
jgi:aubergine-like protein